MATRIPLTGSSVEIPLAEADTVGDLLELHPFPDGCALLVIVDPDAPLNLSAMGLCALKRTPREVRGDAVFLSRAERTHWETL